MSAATKTNVSARRATTEGCPYRSIPNSSDGGITGNHGPRTISHLETGAADPAKLAAGPRATPETVETIREKYGLNDPLIQQYFDYVRGLLHGDFGESILTQHKVSSDLSDRFPATLELVLAAMFLAVAIGVPLGVISALYQNRWPDQLARLFAVSF